MRDVFYRKVEGRTYVAPQFGKEILLKVGADIETKGSVVMSKEAMEELEISENDIVEIYGAWMQKAKAILSQEKDITLIRMDKKIREALPVAIGQTAGVRREHQAKAKTRG
jgi:hypothetical protein